MDQLSDKIDDSFRLESAEDTQIYYQKWAKDYDTDVAKGGYRGPMCLLRPVLKFLKDKNASILDIACGTGKVGKLLAKEHGYTNLSGVDGSSEMIEIAREKNAYKNLYVELMYSNKHLECVPLKSFDAVIGVGCFHPSHLNGSHLKVFLEHTKKGGLVIFGISREYLDETGHERFEMWPAGNFENQLRELEKQGVWRQLDRQIFQDFDTTPNFDEPGHFFVFQMLK